jgi:hypothetical protein
MNDAESNELRARVHKRYENEARYLYSRLLDAALQSGKSVTIDVTMHSEDSLKLFDVLRKNDYTTTAFILVAPKEFCRERAQNISDAGGFARYRPVSDFVFEEKFSGHQKNIPAIEEAADTCFYFYADENNPAPRRIGKPAVIRGLPAHLYTAGMDAMMQTLYEENLALFNFFAKAPQPPVTTIHPGLQPPPSLA